MGEKDYQETRNLAPSSTTSRPSGSPVHPKQSRGCLSPRATQPCLPRAFDFQLRHWGRRWQAQLSFLVTLEAWVSSPAIQNRSHFILF